MRVFCPSLTILYCWVLRGSEMQYAQTNDHGKSTLLAWHLESPRRTWFPACAGPRIVGPSAESDVSAASSVLVALSLMTIRSIFARATGTGYDSGDSSACLASLPHTFIHAYQSYSGATLERTGMNNVRSCQWSQWVFARRACEISTADSAPTLTGCVDDAHPVQCIARGVRGYTCHLITLTG